MELQRVGHDLATKQQQLTNPAFHTRQFINSCLPSCICTMFNSLQRAQHAFSYYASQKMAFGIDLEGDRDGFTTRRDSMRTYVKVNQ